MATPAACRKFFWFPQWALAGGIAALVLVAFMAGRFSGGEPSGVTSGGSVVAGNSPERVLETAVGDHLDRTQMMLSSSPTPAPITPTCSRRSRIAPPIWWPSIA